jgi:hypothetical protein
VNAKFANLVESLEPTFRRLIEMAPVSAARLRGVEIPRRGVYLFSQGAKHLYVGRSNSIRKRIALHCRPGSQHNQATFAFRMARVETGRTKAAYAVTGGRRDLAQDAVFGPAFGSCKARIRDFDLRFVEENEPTRQALLEIYAATVLETPYNDFDTH